jgi:hypothetical protein
MAYQRPALAAASRHVAPRAAVGGIADAAPLGVPVPMWLIVAGGAIGAIGAIEPTAAPYRTPVLLAGLLTACAGAGLTVLKGFQ